MMIELSKEQLEMVVGGNAPVADQTDTVTILKKVKTNPIIIYPSLTESNSIN